MATNPWLNASERLASLGIETPEQVLERADSEKKNSTQYAVALLWRSGKDSPTGFGGWELVWHDHYSGDPVTDRRTNGNRFFHTEERAEAIKYAQRRYRLEEMRPIRGFNRSLFPHWIRLRVLAWLRTVPNDPQTHG